MNRHIINPDIEKYSLLISRMSADQRLYPSHISLCTAMFICWNRQDLRTGFQISRRELMAFSRIASIATYHKCIRELNDYGYIKYQPSYHPKRGSLVSWR